MSDAVEEASAVPAEEPAAIDEAELRARLAACTDKWRNVTRYPVGIGARSSVGATRPGEVEVVGPRWGSWRSASAAAFPCSRDGPTARRSSAAGHGDGAVPARGRPIRSAALEARLSRITCVACRRPDDRCVCHLVRPVANRTGVTILQHPGERRHAFNTARLARMALSDVALHVAWPDADDRLACHPAVPPGAALLYPREDAVDLAEMAAPPPHLVVLDGTWPQARRLYRENPWLADLPHVRLDPARPSRYRIRREPALHCLSTIESVAAALDILEPDLDGLGSVLDAFVAMVDHQAGEAAVRASRHRARSRPSRVERLVAGWDRVVVGYAEVDRADPTVLVSFAAVRPATGATLECAAADLPVAWPAFAGTDPLLVCWSERAAALLDATTGARSDAISLRSLYGSARGGLAGTLDDVLAREGCVSVRVAVSGRAGERLGNAVSLTRKLLGIG